MRGGASFGGVGVALSDNNAHLVKSKPGQPSRRGSLTWSLGPARLPGEMLLSARSPGRRPGHLVAEPLAWFARLVQRASSPGPPQGPAGTGSGELGSHGSPVQTGPPQGPAGTASEAGLGLGDLSRFTSTVIRGARPLTACSCSLLSGFYILPIADSLVCNRQKN